MPGTSAPQGWRRFRFSVRAIFLWITVIGVMLAVTCFFLRHASTPWASLAYWSTASFLTFAAMMAVNRRRLSRSYWSGFAICGWAYYVLVVCAFAHGTQFSPSMSEFDNLITTRISTRIYLAMFANQPKPRMIPLGPVPGSPGVTQSAVITAPGFVAIDAFINVAHLIWTLMIGFCGGCLSVAIYLLSKRPMKLRMTLMHADEGRRRSTNSPSV